MLSKIFKSKIFWIITILIIAVGIFFPITKENSNKDDTIIVASMGEPGSLDPHQIVGGVWESIVMQDLYTGLVERSADGFVVPGVAERYNISKDGKTYTFYLRKSKWSDGVDLTAHDFEFAYKRMLNPQTAAAYAYYLFPIKNAEAYNSGKIGMDSVGVKALSDYVLQIDLEKPINYFLLSLVQRSYYPVPQHVVEKYGKDWSKVNNIVTNGAYKLVEWKPKSYIEATKNDMFYDANNTKIKNVIYFTQEDRSVLLNRFRSGEIDIVNDFPTDQFEWIKNNLSKEMNIYSENAIFFVAINSTKKELQNKKVREALALAIDRDFIVNRVLKTGEIPSYSLVPQNLQSYVPAKFKWTNLTKEERIARAKQLLIEAGYNSKNPLTIEYSYTVDENDKKIAVALANMWKEIGVNVTTNTREIAVHYADLQKQKFEIARAKWTGDFEAPPTFLDLLDSKVAYNFGAYYNKAYEDLFNKAKTTVDTKQGNSLYQQAEQMILDDVALIPVFYYVSKGLVSERVEGYKNNVANLHLVRFMSLKKS